MEITIPKTLLLCLNCETLVSCDYKIKSCWLCDDRNKLKCDGIKILDNNQEIELTLCSQCFLTLRWSIFSKQYNGRLENEWREK